MKKVISIIIIIVIGCLNHFSYKWSKYNKIVGIFTSANESTWEHIKLALLPTFVFIIIMLFNEQNLNILYAGFISLITQILIIPVLFYGTKLVLKREVLWLDICIFLITIIISVLLFYKIIKLNISMLCNLIGFIGTVLIIIMFFLFTLFPPYVFLFRDPITNKYGLLK